MASDISVKNAEGVKIWYNFYESTKTASVMYKGNYDDSYDNEYTGEVVMPSTVTYQGTEFSVTSIGSSAFRDCSSLTSVPIGKGVTSIGYKAFYGCSGLISITIPESVTSIGDCAFEGCTSMTEFDIEDRTTVLSLGSNGTSPLFSDCPLTSIYIGGKLSYGTSDSYGYSPFYRNTTLEEVVIADTEVEIYDNEFYGCSNLKKVSIGDGVTSIGDYAFSGCSSLESFAFGSKVQTIGQEAFSDCIKLGVLNSKSAIPPVCGTQALDDINKWNCTLNVPLANVEDYKSAEQWKEFFFIEGVEGTSNAIGNVVRDNNAVEQDNIYYDLNGRRISAPTRGVFVKNGKLILVK